MIITIDGPAGAGKSTVARALASQLGYQFLDTGAMYRAVVLAAMRRNIEWDNAQELVKLAHHINIDVRDGHVLLNGENVTDAIRATEVTAVIHHVADNPAIRERLVHLQRQIGSTGNFVTEGRDQGTVAFPNAQCKIFLTASAEERARRRLEDLKSRGVHSSLDEVLKWQNERDRRDRSRKVGALVAADDAIEVLTDGLTLDEVVERLTEIVRHIDR